MQWQRALLPRVVLVRPITHLQAPPRPLVRPCGFNWRGPCLPAHTFSQPPTVALASVAPAPQPADAVLPGPFLSLGVDPLLMVSAPGAHEPVHHQKLRTNCRCAGRAGTAGVGGPLPHPSGSHSCCAIWQQHGYPELHGVWQGEQLHAFPILSAHILSSSVTPRLPCMMIVMQTLAYLLPALTLALKRGEQLTQAGAKEVPVQVCSPPALTGAGVLISIAAECNKGPRCQRPCARPAGSRAPGTATA